MKILVVEDDLAQQTIYSDTVDLLNSSLGEDEEKITLILKTNIADAKTVLDDNIAGIMVDLKLGNNEEEESGNDVIREIVTKKRFPVFVYSANLNTLDGSIPSSIFFKKFVKTGEEDLSDIILNLKSIYDTGITKILGRNGIIENQLNRVFWEHMSEVFDKLLAKGINEKQLLRYLTGHLYEYLEINEIDNSFESYFPEEVYIKPPIKLQFFTGDIIEKNEDGKKYIILTPACDIANKNPKKILLSLISDLADDPIRGMKADYDKNPIEGEAEKVIKEINDKKEEAERNLEKLLSNNYSPRYYFLPKSSSFNGGLVNFHHLEVADYATIDQNFKKVATVNGQFLKDVIARFSFYYSRQGAPEVKFSLSDL